MAKTRDGIKLTDIMSAVKEIEGVRIRQGTKHPYVLLYEQLRPCPIAESTDVKRMVVPWLKQVDTLKLYAKQIIYTGIKQGDIMQYIIT
jgi:hypothetical protein